MKRVRQNLFKNVSVPRNEREHVKRFYQEIPKTVIFKDYWEIYEEEIVKRFKEYSVSKIKCLMNINMQKLTPTTEGAVELISFPSVMDTLTDGTDMDEVFDKIRKQIWKDVEQFLKSGSGWTIVSLDSFAIDLYEYKPFAGSSYIRFRDIKVEFKGKEITLDEEIARKEAIINMQNNDNECFKWCVVRVLNPVRKNPQRVTKKLREQAKEYDWSDIPFPTPYEDRSIKRFEVKYGLSINIYGFKWKFCDRDKKPKLLIFPLRRSDVKGKEVDLFYIRKEGEEKEIIPHYCVLKSISRLTTSTTRKDDKGRTYVCRSCLFPFKSQESLDRHVLCMSTTYDK